jgi:hypothetical protein
MSTISKRAGGSVGGGVHIALYVRACVRAGKTGRATTTCCCCCCCCCCCGRRGRGIVGRESWQYGGGGGGGASYLGRTTVSITSLAGHRPDRRMICYCSRAPSSSTTTTTTATTTTTCCIGVVVAWLVGAQHNLPSRSGGFIGILRPAGAFPSRRRTTRSTGADKGRGCGCELGRGFPQGRHNILYCPPTTAGT